MNFSTPGLIGVFPHLVETDPLSNSESSQGEFSASVILSEILLDQKIGKHIHEFNSLSKETDPELFYEALLNLGIRLESDGHLEVAARVYSTMVGAGLRPARGSALGGPLQHRAQERLASLLGHGSFGENLEVFGRSFAKELLKPSAFLAMGAASLAFRGMKFLAMKNLAEFAPGILTRGFGLKALGNLAGFVSEVPAFTLTGRAMDRLLMGPVGAGLALPEAHGSAPLLQEMASAALVLGSLKLFGAAFGRAGQALPLPGTRYAVSVQGVLQQAGMLTGIMAGHGLEILAGFRDQQRFEAFLGESLATLLHFNLMGTLAPRVLGKRFAQLERNLDRYTAQFSIPHSSFLRDLLVSPLQLMGVLGASSPNPESVSLIPQPINQQLAGAKHVLISGCGGGYDVFGAIPLMFDLVQAGKQVTVASLSFSYLNGLEGATRNPEVPNLYEVPSGAATPDAYCPEAWLARWLEKKLERPLSVWAFDKTGVRPLIRAYQYLLEKYPIDAVVLMDGGIDSLLRGDESSLATPAEDLASLAAVNRLNVSTKILASVGFGAEIRDGVQHEQVFARIAELTREGGYLGVAALVPTMPSSQLYREALDFVFANQEQQRKSHIHKIVLQAMQGEYGQQGPHVWLSPLLSLCWFFSLPVVARTHLFLDQLNDTESIWDVHDRIREIRGEMEKQGKIRGPGSIPIPF